MIGNGKELRVQPLGTRKVNLLAAALAVRQSDFARAV